MPVDHLSSADPVPLAGPPRWGPAVGLREPFVLSPRALHPPPRARTFRCPGRLGYVKRVRIAALQLDIAWESPATNYARVGPWVRAAAAAGARLLVLPEMYACGFTMKTDAVAEPEDGPSTAFLVDQARAHGLWIGGSVPALPPAGQGEPGRPFNTFVLAGPEGQLHRYRKIHPFSFGGEDEHFRAGNGFVQVEIDGVRIALFVCYDLRFADEFWQLATTTDVYLVPANWPEPRRTHWIALLQARAIENQAYVVGCNRVGTGGGLVYSGDSRIVDPLGEVLASAAYTESILLADVSAAKVAEVRDRFRFLQDRRS